jgi:arylsulfatase A-like enzyme
VHILLDEDIGIEGIPPDIQHGLKTKKLLKTFFEYHGFRLFGRAYSRYHETRNSLPNMINYTSEPFNQSTQGNMVVRPNRYFDDMRRAGYEIHAVQIPYRAVCSSSDDIAASCYTEDQAGIKELEQVELAVRDKAILISKVYVSLSVINGAFGYKNDYIQHMARRRGWSWPDWWSNEQGMGPLRALTALTTLGGDVAQSRPGQMFFAHLLLPHFPYVFDAKCNVRKPAEWEPAFDAEPLPPNTIESRERRYALYLEQMQCLYRKLGHIFEKWKRAGIFDRLRIIIHGDHGSRIYLHAPTAGNRHELRVSDYADAFSTLLAVKAPGKEPGYDRRWISIHDLLPQLAIPRRALPMAQEASARLTSSDQLPYVYLEQDDSPQMVKRPLPRFGDPAVNYRGAN